MLVKLKFEFPDIFLGMLLAVAIFALGIGFESSRHPTREGPTNSQADNKKQDEGYWSAVGNWLTHDATGLFTGALVIVGGIQIAVFLRQLRLIRESLSPAVQAAEAAQDTAAAALLQARAAIGADRSDLIVSHISLVAFPESDQSNQNVPIPNGAIGRNEFRAIVHFTNSGRSRSRMSELCVEWIVVPRPSDRNADPPQKPIYTNRVGANHIFAADQTIPIKWMAGNNSIIRLLPEQRTAINDNTAWLWIYGRFTYADFMDEIYDAGFVAHWEAVAGGTIGPAPIPNPRGIVLEGPPAYLYRHKRQRQEA